MEIKLYPVARTQDGRVKILTALELCVNSADWLSIDRGLLVIAG